MFEHLDDPAPPSLGANFKSRVLSRGRTLRRRRRAGWGGATSVLIAAVGVVGLYGSALDKVDDVERVEVAGTGAPEEATVRTVLLLGQDTRENDPPAAMGRTDTLIALRIDQRAGRVAALPIPRDLAVTAPSGDEQVRINTIASTDGLAGLVAVVETQLGVPVDHVVSVDLDGFVRLLDLIGGIEIHTPGPMRDLPTGLELPGPECVHLDGIQGLQLVRARHLETQIDGRWTADTRGDLGRIDRLQVLLLAGLERLGDTRPSPLTANRLADWVLENVVVDETLDRDSLVALARVSMNLAPESLDFGTLPVEATVLHDTQAAVLTLADGADEAIGDFNDGTPVDSHPQQSITPCD